MREIHPDRMKRKAKYASIRFSYHPGHSDSQRLFWDVRAMQVSGYSVGIWAVDTPGTNLEHLKEMAETLEIDFRIKEFLDSTHGNYKYPKGVDGNRKKCLCKPSELLIAPDGRLFRCHYDLYHGINSYGHILDRDVGLPSDFLRCDNYGRCSPCDVKEKFSRHQVMGHCSVEIKELDNT